MAEQGSGEKSEEPTPHKLREAREKGQVAKSKEITVACLLLATYWMLRYTAQSAWGYLMEMSQSILYLIRNISEFSPQFVANIFFIAGRGFFLSLAPVFAVALLVGALVEVLQTGFMVSLDPLSPKLEKLNPIEGFKKMFSMQGLVELVKSTLKIVIVFWIAYIAIRDDLEYIPLLINLAPWDSMLFGANMVFKIVTRVALFYIGVAALDYLYRRFEYMKNLKMTKQEVKEEYKRLEGDPLVKQRIRDLQRQTAQQRMMASVPKADVVVTNPTEVAVALEYHAAKMSAPTVIAKGERLIAQEIRKLAEEYNIPVIENEPLARTLLRASKINQEIPLELFQAVAEVLAFVYKLKRDKYAKFRAAQTSSQQN